MAEERLSTSSGQANPGTLDLDISAVLIAERLIGEMFGWRLVDWDALSPHKRRKFFFERRRDSDPSIHDQLKPLFGQCDPNKGDYTALRPSPVVNTNLSKLVGHLCRHVGRHGLPVGGLERPVLERTEAQDRLHLAAIDHLLGRIDGSALMRERSMLIKQVAAAAEGELEMHFVDLINERLERSFLPGGVPDRYKLRNLRDQASGQVEETRLLNGRELAGLAMPEPILGDDDLVRIEMARILLGRFPYVHNYELMLFAEIAMLQHPLRPRFVPERLLSSGNGRIESTSIERFDAAVAGASARLSRPDETTWDGSLAKRTIAICGSGPLPMSAIFLHLLTQASVVLIDDDGSAVERSRRLITNLERLQVLRPGALSVHLKNAGDVTFRAPGDARDMPGEAAITCDAVMIASLVDSEAKMSIARQFQRDANAPELLIMRSARGLSARLAYDPLPTKALCQGGLVYCGETLPATQVATHLDRVEAIERSVACTESPDVLAIAHPDVVNTTEIYRRTSIFVQSGDFAKSETIGDWIERLEAISAPSGSSKPER